MTSPSTTARGPLPGLEALRLEAVPLAAWCVFGVALLAGLDLWIDSARITKALGDTDDATRLVQVREWLAGAPWFDTTLPLFGAPDHLVSHWSRLIDLGLGALMRMLGLVLPAAAAETTARYVWPLLMLLLLTFVLAKSAAHRAGPAAGYVAIGLAVTCLTGLVQYMPGRIDHHNAMVLGAVTGCLMLARSIVEPRVGWIAGVGFGFGIAIGYEALAITVACLACAGLFALAAGRGAAGIMRAAIGFATTLFTALLLTTAPSRWLVSHCDALSLNLVLLATSCAAALAVALLPGTTWRLPVRFGLLAAIGGAGAVLYFAAQPACLKGPFGELDPGIGPAWLVTVAETQNAFWLLRATPGPAIVFVMSAIAGLAAAWTIWRNDRDDAALAGLAMLAIATALACWQIKLIPYASFLAVPPLAAVIARIPGRGDISAATMRFGAALAASQLTLAIVANPIGAAVIPVKKDVAEWLKDVKACIESKSVAPLAALPKGLYFAERDLGPFIVALTGNPVVAAPYHRMDKAILETEQVFFGPVEEAARRLAALGVGYVAICPGLTPSGEGKRQGLHLQLLTGHAPAFLEPVPLAAPTPLKVWRLKAR